MSLVHSSRVHSKVSHSPLSTESEDIRDFRGFQNLVMLLLFVNNLRLVVENFLKYGLLIKLPQLTNAIVSDVYYCARICCIFPIVIIVAITIEKVYASSLKVGTGLSSSENIITRSTATHSKNVHRRKTTKVKEVSVRPKNIIEPNFFLLYIKVILQTVNIILTLVSPNYFTFYYIKNPLLASIPCFLSMIHGMKMISYALVNNELSFYYLNSMSITEYEISYPDNLSLSNILYFCVAPTLCYQPTYPRSSEIRLVFCIKRSVELLTLWGMVFFIYEQYSKPTMRNSLRPYQELNFVALLERVLKLSVPSIYIWLCIFYATFHSYLNLWAELLYFGDRQFYRPWWNASTIAQYWRLWNIPVYTFFKRHVYLPFRMHYKNLPKIYANAVAFLLSAIGHEVLIAVPTHILKGWAFGGMMAQVPLILISEIISHYERKEKKEEEDKNVGNIGNYFFWISFCILGQPLIALLYFREWYIKEHPNLDNL